MNLSFHSILTTGPHASFVNEMATLFHGCLYTTTESVKNINDNIFYNLSVKITDLQASVDRNIEP